MNRFGIVTFILILVLLVSQRLSALQVDSSQVTPIKVLNEDWLVYNKHYSAYVPLLQTTSPKPLIINQWVRTDQYRNYRLVFSVAPATSFFINNKLLYRNQTSERVTNYFDINELNDLYGDQLFISFYHPKGNLPFQNVFIGFDKSIVKEKLPLVAKSPIHLQTRKLENKHNYYVGLFLLILLVTAVLRNSFPKHFDDFLGYKNIISNNLIEETIMLKLFSIPVLLAILLNSFLVSFVLLSYYQEQLSILRTFDELVKNEHLKVFFSNTVLAFIFFIAKYFVLQILAWLFGFTEIIKVQYYDYLKTLLKINCIAVFLMFVMELNNRADWQEMGDFIKATIVAVLFILLVKTIYVATKVTHFRNVYLFSYLCTSEILPTIILVRLILN